ncbi:MAG: prepilin-type N-terminal cleavage/methylation domain-containing protein [Sedimentisphaerales bacterium]|nr:prepilin-type N-terminal cleavage/methylation domain-containing protein [Sedimentisphaerales bacterium]
MLHNKYKTGFTLVELLIALAISSILLTAVALAFQSSIMNYTENEDIFKTINSARQALCRITTQLRTAQAVDSNAPSNQCTFITPPPDSQTFTYDYRSADQKLYLVSGGTDYLLCDNVTAMTFTKDTFIHDVFGPCVKSVQISMTVKNGNIENTISAASVIRRNLE